MKAKLVLAVLLESAYALISRLWLPQISSGIELELLITGFRIATAIAFWLLFRELILSRFPNPKGAVHPLFAVVILCLLLEPLLSGNYGLPDTTTKSVFAFTSIAVAIHEELVYRGVLQNLLERRSGRFVAIVISSAVFAFYHYGAQPLNPSNLVSLFAAGCIFGLVYSATGSLVLAITVHALDDAVWAFSPFQSSPLPQVIGVGFTLLGLLAAVAWTRLRSNTALKRDAASAAPLS